jgi:putative hydrolase of the HAD superfamily
MISKTIVFDLDDTLINEIDYLKSAFNEIANNCDSSNESLFENMMKWYYNKENVFQNLIKIYPEQTIDRFKEIYRNHFPNFDPKSENRKLLLDIKECGSFLGLITDGFSITQRNKIKALDIEDIFDLIIVSEEFGSEKPNRNNYEIFHQFKTDEYFYIGDNVSKDFITPNSLGWQTVCLLDAGFNIHSQDFNKDSLHLPKFRISKLSEIENILDSI